MRNIITNKSSKKNKQVNANNEIELLTLENHKLKNIIFELKKENNKNKGSTMILTEKNKYLSKKNSQFKKENDVLRKLNTFTNFQEFLANSYVSPIIEAPFYSEDKRIFAFMDYVSKYLIKNLKKIKEKPLVSIIMPTYNRENIIFNAINSVLKQKYENWELIIINDGSTDNTLNLLNDLPNNKIKIISYNKNKGHAHARNIGLKKAQGEYIMYLDSDNEWDSKYIETMIGAFIEIPEADALYSGQLLYKDYNSKPYAVRFGCFNKPLLHNRNYIDINCFCHKSSIFNEISGFDEDLTKLVDWDYILRISTKFKIYSIPVLLSKYYELDYINRVTELPFDYDGTALKIIQRNISSIQYNELSHKISIIIPSYESMNELKLCIEAILSFNLKDMVDIIIVDNNSSFQVKEYLTGLQSEQINVIYNDINYGFTYAVKQGINFSNPDSDILILNNDAILTKGALEQLQQGAYSYKNCGLIVPHELVSEDPHMNLHVPYADSQFKCDVTPSKNHHNIINMPIFHNGGLLELDFAPFFCTYIKREVYNKTLGLDPELGRHYRSDRVFSDFIRHILKMKIYQEPNAYVYHKHQVATNILRKNKKEFNFMFDKNQWPEDLAHDLGYEKPLWD